MSWKEIIEGKIDTKMSAALQKKQEVVSERTVEEENEYQKFFQKALKKFGVESPAEAKLVFIVMDLRGPRVLIAPKEWKSGIAPTESVPMNTIELAK